MAGQTCRVYRHGELVRVLAPTAWQPRLRLADMDADGVSVQALSPIPFTLGWDLDAYDPRTLPVIAEVFGLDRLVVGTDYPLSAAERPAGAAVGTAAATGLLDLEDWPSALEVNARNFLHGPKGAVST
jgi:hypothetical protein